MTANPHVALALALNKPPSLSYSQLIDEVYALRRQLNELTSGEMPACATAKKYDDEPIPGLLDNVEEAS